jgi:hypothetical protein
MKYLAMGGCEGPLGVTGVLRDRECPRGLLEAVRGYEGPQGAIFVHGDHDGQ